MLIFGIAAIVVCLVIMIVCIRHERKVLQIRAQAFIKRPLPNMLCHHESRKPLQLDPSFVSLPFQNRLEFEPDELYPVNANTRALDGAHALIERYATKGRIRQTAKTSCLVNMANLDISIFRDTVKNNEEARLYLDDCETILEDIWRMGIWQWVEDTIEMKRPIPEIEEEALAAKRGLEKQGVSRNHE